MDKEIKVHYNICVIYVDVYITLCYICRHITRVLTTSQELCQTFHRSISFNAHKYLTEQVSLFAFYRQEN